MSFKDLRISHKLIACFSSVLLIVVATTGIMFHTLSQLDNVAELNSASSEVLDRLDVAATRFFDVAFTSRGAVMIKFDSELKRYDASRKAYAAAMDQIKKSAANYPDMAKVADAVDTVATRWLREVGDPVFEMMQDGSKVDDAFDLSIAPSAGDIIVKYRDAIADARGKVQAWSNGAQREQDAHMSFLRKLQVAGGLVAMFAAAFAGWLLSRAIGRPLVAMTSTMTCLASGDHSVVVPATGRRDEIGHMADAVQCFKEAALAKLRLEAETAETRRQATVADAARESEKTEAAAKLQYAVDTLAESLKRLSNGDLTCRIETSFVGEADRLRADFNASLETLEQAMLTVAANVQALRSGSGEITSAADDLSRRTEQQAASLEETAAALDQITATVKKTAAGALHARDAVTNARSDAEASGRIVQRAVDAMSGIETSSRQIGQIIGVIDEIAFQTNLLALNAGVEAARAGDAGRGFAVVASEVRALAQRSAEAAREIKGLISASAVHVGQGVELVGETGRSLARIVTQVAEINGVVADIAASAQEQATALGEVNTAINQMDQVTQQNAAMVEQSTAASHALSHDAAALGALVAKFNTGTALVPQAAAREMRRPAVRQVAPPRPAVAAKPSATRPALKHTRASGGSIVQRLNAVAKVDSESWEEF